ncbi:hypothetical protein EJ08DRAFT_651952 [Tothia fuscella]|uniref:Phytanoyl-CoA dioxygenase n=1 Tax=Tothia fuscella TaxID=1048955 RepID=A0A9P4NL82_9PEZI|nr:hypothetical protein EJ08DRAFT_651952 [Tothia fuscella]
MELYNLLVKPDEDFSLRWHRDDIAPTATKEEELERLNKPAWHAQWKLALYDDRSLVIIPRSHKRARTQGERDADPYAEIPGQKVVSLRAGDIVFYNNNILHRGVYSKSVERMALHGSMGVARGSSDRARNALQHGVGEWVDKCDFKSLPNSLLKRAEGMRDRLIEMGKTNGDVGFAQED